MAKIPFLTCLFFLSVFVCADALAGTLDQSEIQQIEEAFGISLSQRQKDELGAIVKPETIESWREKANSRIRAFRQSDLSIIVRDSLGNPVQGAIVEVKLQKNAFRFGGVVTVADLTDANGKLAAEGSTTADWQNITTQLFNAVGLNNGLKPKITGQHKYIPGFLAWAEDHDLDVRAHLLMWPGGGSLDSQNQLSGIPGTDYGNHLSTSRTSDYASHNVLGAVEAWANAADHEKADRKALLKNEVDSEILEWVRQWDVYQWDVVNETIGNTLLQQIIGWEQMAEWFKIAKNNSYRVLSLGRSRYSSTGFFINEFKIISAKPAFLDGGSFYNSRKNSFMDRIDKIISDGGPIDGIGFQSRFKYGPVDQNEVIKRIDDFSTRYPDFQLAGTEFEIKDGRDYLYTELERARMTEEILTTYYSHENMVGLNAWDFMSASSDPDTTEITAAMAWYDGRIKLNGLVWYYLHRIRYSTDVRLESDHTGTITVPAHKGDYLVSVTHNNETYFAEVTLTGNRVLEFEVEPGFQINAGLSDAWFNPSTSGQGFFITVLPDHGVVTLAWFTYDTQLPSEDASAELGDPGHRWLTATGPYQENQSIMNVEMTSGGLFDSAAEIQRTDPPGSDGNIILKFANCEEATVKYSIPSVGLSGLIPIVRVAADNIPLCQALTGLPD